MSAGVNRPGVCTLCRNYTTNGHGRMVFCATCCKKLGGCRACGLKFDGHNPLIDFQPYGAELALVPEQWRDGYPRFTLEFVARLTNSECLIRLPERRA